MAQVVVQNPTEPVAGTRNPFSHPFHELSPWNHPIGSDAVYGASSNVMVQALKLSTAFNGSQFTDGFFDADDVDPTRSFVLTETSPITGGTTVSIPVPDSATVPPPSGSGFDRQFNIFSPNGISVDHFFGTERQTDDNFTATLHRRWSAYGDGIGNNPGHQLGSAASGLANLGGLIRLHELDGGNIPHALAGAFGIDQLVSPANHSQGTGYIWPATTTDGTASDNTGVIPYGQLFAIPQSVDLDVELAGENDDIKTIAKAMQNYGLYPRDRTVSSQAIYALYPEFTSAREFEIHGGSGSAIGQLYQYLRPVLNNAEDNRGGGGTPVVPISAPLTPPP